jgi:hypothetical protein
MREHIPCSLMVDPKHKILCGGFSTHFYVPDWESLTAQGFGRCSDHLRKPKEPPYREVSFDEYIVWEVMVS